ncbi:hypothetical protein OFDDKENP_00187 [Aeromonas phage B614]|nr:hypothetical protein OFDDKENP_00187 [Aeromonas phage B614]UYD58336.1 hypothetical protein JNEOFJEA_00257 [Aeromonas phage UP87]UYD58450.1 hypothetical protein IPAKJDPM_00107 [Aeromonas phage avDM14-QBC]UYD58666.1 hypothetical protein HNNIDBEH_00073 [Aeromonas phage avDM10-HWA]UYD59031.1 hypothetical protein OFOPOMKI_00181 [Aeromonas phage avDM7-IJDJ]UYD59843.1 hypothetical protein LEHPIFIF_00070 [Aeromonas phage avDM9-HANS]
MKNEFEGSIDATDFIENLKSNLDDARLTEWCATTDYNFNANTLQKLDMMREIMAELVEELDEAC